VLLRCTGRNLLLALAFTAGTVGLRAATGQARPVFPNQHIVAQSKSLEKKKAVGFTAVLKASAVHLGKILIWQVKQSLAQKQALQHRIARKLPAESQKKLISGHEYRKLKGFFTVGIVIPACELACLPEADYLLQYECPASRQGRVLANKRSILGNKSSLSKFCAPHHVSNSSSPNFVQCSGIIPASWPSAMEARKLRRSIAKGQKTNMSIVRYQARVPAQSHGIERYSSHCLPWPARGVIFSISLIAHGAKKRFPIDPVRHTELLAHGAMGAPNALRSDRPRDNWT
jgi:hypothetical protein